MADPVRQGNATDGRSHCLPHLGIAPLKRFIGPAGGVDERVRPAPSYEEIGAADVEVIPPLWTTREDRATNDRRLSDCFPGPRQGRLNRVTRRIVACACMK